MNKSRNFIIASAVAVTFAILLLTSYVYPSVTSNTALISGKDKMDNEGIPEVFDVSPIITSLNPSETMLESMQTQVIPEITDLSTDHATSADFILPIFKEASALSPNNNAATFTEWTVPTANAAIRSPKYDAATNSIWFSEGGVNRIARLNLTASPPQLTEWTLPTPNAGPNGLVLEPSTGRIYFVENAVSKIARLDPTTNGIVEWSLPLNMPGFAAQPVSYIWLTMDSSGKLYTHSRCQSNCQFGHQWVLELNPSTNFARAWNIAGGSGNLEGITVDMTTGQTVVWVTEKIQNTITRLVITGPTANQLTKWPIPQPGSNPWGISVDAGGLVYFTQQSGNRIARLIPSTNQITQWIVPTASSNSAYMAVDPAGVVYFGEYDANKIGRLVPSTNIFTEWNIPTATSRPAYLSMDPLGNLYFEEEGNNIKVGRLS